ncbi:FUSC family protein [Micromonospora sp. KC606]|uniref:FUSC family protein n=1 Tax=Micromonospora sp. KC606 TaxID=2530379 RepID=UPI001A9D6FF3|nr:FUSC family protein [Micromonospora sp. KC606]
MGADQHGRTSADSWQRWSREIRRVAARSGSPSQRATAVRLRQWEIILLIAVQAGVAAALAWWFAFAVLGNPNPVFAPAAAVGTIAAAVGQRTRRAVELLVGVGLGIAVGDALIYVIGTGAWQTGAIVAFAIALSLFLADRGGTVVSQVGGTAVLIAALSSAERNLEPPRIVDVAVGGVIGLVVVALLIPINPMRMLDRAAAPVFELLSRQVREVAAALSQRDEARAARALNTLRGMDDDLQRLRDALRGAEEVMTIAPARWRRREDFADYARGAKHLGRVLGNCRTIARRAATTLQDDEPVPDALCSALTELADAIEELRRECRAGRVPERTRRAALNAAEQAGRAAVGDIRAFGDVVCIQLRTAASDLLRATGYDADEANRRTRGAARGGELAARPRRPDVEQRLMTRSSSPGPAEIAGGPTARRAPARAVTEGGARRPATGRARGRTPKGRPPARGDRPSSARPDQAL